MKILMVLEKDFPPDERVEKEALSLIENGHSVDIACYTFSNATSDEFYKGIKIHRKKISNIRFKFSAAILIFPFYFSFWKKFLFELFRKSPYDAIHIHDLPLSKIGFLLKKKYHTILVCDQHEYYSNWIIKTAHYNRGAGKIIKRFSNWQKYEKKYLRKADKVITVEEPLRECYINEVKIIPDKIFTLPNTPLKSTFVDQPYHNDIIEKYKDHFVLFYAGGIDRLRGLDLVFNSLKEIQKDIPEILFVIGGRESGGYNLKQLTHKYAVTDIVDFVGWIDQNVLPSYISASKICVFTPPVNRDEINKTIATKIYQYIAVGKPVIVSEAKMMKSFVEENKCGIAVKDENDLIEAVKKLNKEPEYYDLLSCNAKKTSLNYLWDKTNTGLLDFYKHL